MTNANDGSKISESGRVGPRQVIGTEGRAIARKLRLPQSETPSKDKKPAPVEAGHASKSGSGRC